MAAIAGPSREGDAGLGARADDLASGGCRGHYAALTRCTHILPRSVNGQPTTAREAARDAATRERHLTRISTELEAIKRKTGDARLAAEGELLAHPGPLRLESFGPFVGYKANGDGTGSHSHLSWRTLLGGNGRVRTASRATQGASSAGQRGEGPRRGDLDMATDVVGATAVAELRKAAWLRLAAAVAVGCVVSVVVLLSTTSTIVWWGGFIVCAELAWTAYKRFREASRMTGRGVGADVWIAMALGLCLVAGTGVAATIHWRAPLEMTSDVATGTCWSQEADGNVSLVECSESTATLKITSVVATDEDCPAASDSYIDLDDGTVGCLDEK